MVLWVNTAAAEMMTNESIKSGKSYANVKAITNPPMFTAMNKSVSHANNTTAFNTVVAHFR